MNVWMSFRSGSECSVDNAWLFTLTRPVLSLFVVFPLLFDNLTANFDSCFVDNPLFHKYSL